MKKLFLQYSRFLTTIFVAVLVFFIFFIVRDTIRHGSLPVGINSWFYTPLFDLQDSKSCYELQPGEQGPLLLKRDPRYANQKRSPGVPEGSVMQVAGADFEIETYFYTCQKFTGYFTLKDGMAKWYLTEVL